MKTHIKIAKNKSNALVLVCGDPERAKWLGSKLDKFEPVAANREYHSFKGEYKKKPILILSHGVGSAGAAICFNEVIDAGAKKIIRLGTAGGFYKGSKIGDIIVPVAAIREDGATPRMIPIEYPAIADTELVTALTKNLQQQKQAFQKGIILTSDLFYPSFLDTRYDLYSRAGVKAVEMECSTLFVLGTLRNVACASVLVLDGDATSTAPDDYDPDPKRLAKSIESGFKAALEALVSE